MHHVLRRESGAPDHVIRFFLHGTVKFSGKFAGHTIKTSSSRDKADHVVQAERPRDAVDGQKIRLCRSLVGRVVLAFSQYFH